MNALILFLCGALAPPYQPTAPPYSSEIVVAPPHLDQPIVKPAPVLIQGVPFDRRLPGPGNWFRCPHCGRSDCWMFLGQALRQQFRISNADLDRVGWKNWGVLYDNLRNRNWKPPQVQATAPRTGCEGGMCHQRGVCRPLRSFLFRR